MIQPKGKIITFDQIKQGKSLLHLKDGNYLEVVLNVHKVSKTEIMAPDGNPVYMVNTSISFAVWKPEEIAQLEE